MIKYVIAATYLPRRSELPAYPCVTPPKERTVRTGQSLAVILIAIAYVSDSFAAEPSRIDFARDVQPIFKRHCFSCHDGRKHKAGLRLDVRASALRGGESGKPAVVPG